jgi:hypothetical protein
MKNLLQSLEDGIKSFSFLGSGIWSAYYEEAARRPGYIAAKQKIITGWFEELPLKKVLDLGANEGVFSELFKDKADTIISADFDHGAVNKLFNRTKEKSIFNIHPLIIDLSSPSPGIGVNNEERTPFLKRAKADLTLALALIHHLAIEKNIPFQNIFKMFSALTKWLVIEFVDKEDEKIQFMLQRKKINYDWYTLENFQKELCVYFEITDSKTIEGTSRTLHLCKKRILETRTETEAKILF